MIIIDPGHGGRDPGAVGPGGLKEKEAALSISLLLAEKLKPLATEIRLTREDDRDLLLEQRTSLANSLGAGLLLSIHHNAYTNPDANGIEIWHSYRGDFGSQFYAEGKRIAQILQHHLVQGTGLKDRGIKTRLVDRKTSPIYGLDYYAIIRKARCPALIVELGFISNPNEESLLATLAFRDKTAGLLATGLTEALKLKPKKQPEPGPQLLKETTVVLDNTELKGFILHNRSYVEVRKLAETLGAKVHWDQQNNRVIITR